MDSDYESSVVRSESSCSEARSSTSSQSSQESLKDDKLAKNCDQEYTKKRTKSIYIGIIILISLGITGMTVAMIVIFKSTNTTKKTETTKATVSGMMVTRYKPIIYDVGNGGASGDPPCLSYTVVDDPLRSINAPGSGGVCDNGPLFNTNIGGRWIRFVGAGGTIIPQTSPGLNRCGAFITLWLNVTLPSTIGTIFSSSLYFEISSDVMTMAGIASIVNCGNFYVYFLPPVQFCNSRYCTT